MRDTKRLLIVTDHHYVSAMLFHGFGLPPWYDLPELQENAGYRRKMTERVNAVIEHGWAAGFRRFDVHEAFPVNLMLLSEHGLLIRGADRFLPERGYRGAALLRMDFSALKVQPRRRLLGKMTLNGRVVEETDLIVSYLFKHGIPVIHPEAAGHPTRRQRMPSFPAELVMFFDAAVPLKTAAYYPGITRVRGNRVYGRARDAEQLLDLYRYAGLLMQASRKY